MARIVARRHLDDVFARGPRGVDRELPARGRSVGAVQPALGIAPRHRQCPPAPPWCRHVPAVPPVAPAVRRPPARRARCRRDRPRSRRSRAARRSDAAAATRAAGAARRAGRSGAARAAAGPGRAARSGRARAAGRARDAAARAGASLWSPLAPVVPTRSCPRCPFRPRCPASPSSARPQATPVAATRRKHQAPYRRCEVRAMISSDTSCDEGVAASLGALPPGCQRRIALPVRGNIAVAMCALLRSCTGPLIPARKYFRVCRSRSCVDAASSASPRGLDTRNATSSRGY